MKVGDVSPCVQPWGMSPASPQELVEVCRHAEALGFYALTIAYRDLHRHGLDHVDVLHEQLDRFASDVVPQV